MQIPSETAEQFIYSLQHAEKTRNVENLVRLFAEDAELVSPAFGQPLKGQDGVRTFWRKHLSMFRRVRSEVVDIVENGSSTNDVAKQSRAIVLEWVTDAILPSGKPFTYHGVSILELNQGRIKRFRTYYDSFPVSIQTQLVQSHRESHRDELYRQAG